MESKGHFFSLVLLADVGAWKSSKEEEYVGEGCPILSFTEWEKQFANAAFR